MANPDARPMTPAAALARHLEWLEYALTAAREEEDRRRGRLDKATPKNRDKRAVRLAEVRAEVDELSALVQGIKDLQTAATPATKTGAKRGPKPGSKAPARRRASTSAAAKAGTTTRRSSTGSTSTRRRAASAAGAAGAAGTKPTATARTKPAAPAAETTAATNGTGPHPRRSRGPRRRSGPARHGRPLPDRRRRPRAPGGRRRRVRAQPADGQLSRAAGSAQPAGRGGRRPGFDVRPPPRRRL